MLLLRCRGRRARSRHRRRSSTPLTRSRSSAQRPREPSLATKRRLLQSSAKEDAERIPQLRLHPRLGIKKTIRSQEVEVIGAAPAQTESSDDEAPAREQRGDKRARPKPPSVPPPAKLLRHAGLILPPRLSLPPQPPHQHQQQQQQQQDDTELGEDAFRRTPEDETEARQHQIAGGAAREAPQRQRRGGWFQKCQELSDAILHGDHHRAMELAYRFRATEAQDQGYYSKK